MLALSWLVVTLLNILVRIEYLIILDISCICVALQSLEIRILNNACIYHSFLIHTVRTPSTIIHGLFPAHTYYWIVVISHVRIIIVEVWLIIGHFLPPYQRIRVTLLNQRWG